ncbi:transposase family protein [Streptomyces sp. NPDC058092]|uniref:transposase family protein n=1 Tax=Streptomyces sp. NPDC058092 TaxID=3346336 RepID=UPI0036E98252
MFSVDASGPVVVIEARTRSRVPAGCSGCGVVSDWIHSRYVRHLADAAIGGHPVRVDLSVRRLYCENASCPKVTFAEQVPGLTVRYQREQLPLVGVPACFQTFSDTARKARERGAPCPACATARAETAAEERVVVSSEHWIAVVPFAARRPYEVHVLARRHVPDLTALERAERAELALIYRAVLGCFETVADSPLPYMALWFQASAGPHGRDLTHLHAQVFSDRYSSSQVRGRPQVNGGGRCGRERGGAGAGGERSSGGVPFVMNNGIEAFSPPLQQMGFGHFSAGNPLPPLRAS